MVDRRAPDVITPTHFFPGEESRQPPSRCARMDYPWVESEMLAGRMVSFPSLEELPAEAAVDRETCRRVGIKSNLTPAALGGW